MADMSGAIVLGVVGSAVGIVAVNYWLSDPGESWFEQISSSFGSKDSAAPLPAKQAARQLGAKPVIPPPGVKQPGARQPSAPPLRSHSSRPTTPTMAQASQMLSHIPETITPDMVREVASRLNAMLHLNLPTTGVITLEMTRAIKQLQQQLGFSPTGLPDARLLHQLQSAASQALPVARKAAAQVAPLTAPLASQATNFISKLFGGPPSSHSTGPDEGVRKAQKMINDFNKDHALSEDGIMGTLTANALKKFQAAQGLPVTGGIDSATHDSLEKGSGPGFWDKLASMGHGGDQKTGWGGYFAGADAGGDWHSETSSLGASGQDVIAKAIAEGDLRTLRGLGRALKAAGFPQAGAACDAASKAGASHVGYYGDGW